ncbi:MAG: hypothetical protein OXB84_02620, partial [Halobacteriovoraceae bacterium]|nr:hypothetical protein [Halobacteriovoraceae bacterium]
KFNKNNFEDISSSQIRKHIINGEIDKANHLLGRDFFITGKVIRGKSRGRSLGFPTANLNYDSNRIIPRSGVYYTRISLGKKVYNSITNIGSNPTFNESNISVESFIIDFKKNIYNKNISLYFLKRHRDIVKFKTITELKTKIADDVKKAKEYFLK